MRKIIIISVLLSCLVNAESNNGAPLKSQYPFNKVVIWGYKLHSHTHSYIHWGYYRAFKHLGYDTYWLDDADDISQIDFAHSLFLTMGNDVNQRMPLRKDCRYILHNCDSPKYDELKNMDLCITLQVYTHDCLKRDLQQIEDCIFLDCNARIIYMSWATDLLPDEIEKNKERIKNRQFQRRPIAYYIGTLWGGLFGNLEQLKPFMQACQEQHIEFKNAQTVSMEDNVDLIMNSYMAPAIQGKWQCDNGYIPCRIFKNISYGHIGITNSETVYKLFKGKIVYNPDTYQLFFDARNKMETMTLDELIELMDFVKEKHTYLNRIEMLLRFLNRVKFVKSEA